jgi:diaminopimelate decarboxylase
VADRLAVLRRALPGGVSLHYAMKANPYPALVEFIARQVDGLDVASAGELRVALQTGTAPEHISFAGPGNMDWELERAIAADCVINVEPDNELRRIARIAESARRRARVAIRVNPDFELKGSGMRMSGGPSALMPRSFRRPSSSFARSRWSSRASTSSAAPNVSTGKRSAML